MTKNEMGAGDRPAYSARKAAVVFVVVAMAFLLFVWLASRQTPRHVEPTPTVTVSTS
jgi:hypothetical protein